MFPPKKKSMPRKEGEEEEEEEVQKGEACACLIWLPQSQNQGLVLQEPWQLFHIALLGQIEARGGRYWMREVMKMLDDVVEGESLGAISHQDGHFGRQ